MTECGKFLEVTDFNSTHNHDVNAEIFRLYSKQRKLDAKQAGTVVKMSKSKPVGCLLNSTSRKWASRPWKWRTPQCCWSFKIRRHFQKMRLMIYFTKWKIILILTSNSFTAIPTMSQPSFYKSKKWKLTSRHFQKFYSVMLLTNIWPPLKVKTHPKIETLLIIWLNNIYQHFKLLISKDFMGLLRSMQFKMLKSVIKPENQQSLNYSDRFN